MTGTTRLVNWKPFGSRWTARLANANVKSCATIAVLAMSIASPGVGTATAQSAAGQLTMRPKPLAALDESPDNRPPTGGEREIWRKTILKTPRPNNGEGCYTATYPETEWREVDCETPPGNLYSPKAVRAPRPDAVGGGGFGSDFSAEVTGLISEAEGSFDIVTLDSIPPQPNQYSLQLNTNPILTETCDTSPNNTGKLGGCQGWEQFVYNGAGAGGYIQYWLLNYDPKGLTCPKPISSSCNGANAESDGWCSVTARPGDCVINAVNSAPVPAESLTSLQYLKVTADVAGVNGATNDSIAVTDGNTVWSASGDNHFPDLGSSHLGSGWQVAEFNVFGTGNGSQAVFNPGSTVVVRTSVDSGKPSALTGPTGAPKCDLTGFTGETNNLSLVSMGLVVAEGSLPSVVFTERNPAASLAGDQSISPCLALAGLPIGTIYRWYNPNVSDHFYTQDPAGESAPTDGYIYEGARFALFPSGTLNTAAFTRWFNPSTSHHFYTANKTEEKAAPGLGFVFEGNIGNIETTDQLHGSEPLFRWYNPSTGDHFYTTDPDGEAAPSTGYHQERDAGFVKPVNSLPAGAIFRWYNPSSGDHFYTQDADGEFAPTDGYEYEGLRYVLFPSGTKDTVVFTRWYNPTTDHHFYTADPAEIKTLPGLGFHQEESIGNIVPATALRLPGTVALNRWYNSSTGDHFFTTDSDGELAPAAGYAFEKVAGFVKPGEN